MNIFITTIQYLAIASIIGIIINSAYNGTIYRLRAQHNVTFYRLKLEGRQNTSMSAPSAAGEVIATMLSGEHFYTPNGGMSVTRVGSKTRAPECYLAIWNVSQPELLASAIAKTFGGTVEKIDGFEAKWEGKIVEANRGEISTPVAPPDNFARHADTLTETLAGLNTESVITISFTPLKNTHSSDLREHMSKLIRERRVEQQANNQASGTLLNARVIACAENTKAAGQLTDSALSSLPAYHFKTKARIVSSRTQSIITIISGIILTYISVTRNFPTPISILTGLMILGGAFTTWKDPANQWVRIQAHTGVVLPTPLQWWNHFIQRKELQQTGIRDIGDEYHAPQTITRMAKLKWPKSVMPFNNIQVAASLAQPDQQAGLAADYGGTRQTDSPVQLREHHPKTLIFGVDQNDNTLWLPQETLGSGIFSVGQRGSGKTVLTSTIWKADCATNPHRQLRVWWETKGEGAPLAKTLAEEAGTDPLLLNIHEPDDQYRLNLFYPTNNPKLAAENFVDAMVYAWDEGAFGADNRPTLIAAIYLALTAPTECYAALGTKRRNVLRFAWVLTGGGEPAVRKDLLDTIMAAKHQANHDGTNPELLEAWGLWESNEIRVKKYDGARGGAATHPLNSSRNKLETLSQTKYLWTPNPNRKDISVDQFLKKPQTLVLNFGGVEGKTGTSSEIAEKIASMTMFLFWRAIQSNCAGWAEKGRFINIYSDELAMIAGKGSGEDIIALMVDEGRQKGVRLVLATQRFTQLPERTQEATKGFGVRNYLREQNTDLAAIYANELNFGDPEGKWTAQDIISLKSCTSFSLIRAHNKQYHPVTVTWPYPNSYTLSQLEGFTPTA